MKKIIIAVLIAVVAAGGAGFYGGMKYQQSKSPAKGNGQFFMSENGQGGQGQGMTDGNMRGGLNGGMTSGEIISKDDKSITLKLKDGGSKIVLYSGSTQFEKTVVGSVDDFAVGTSIMVTGSSNSDGSLTAKTVQIRPSFDQPQPSGQPQTNQN